MNNTLSEEQDVETTSLSSNDKIRILANLVIDRILETQENDTQQLTTGK